MTTAATDGRIVAADTLICTGSNTLEMWTRSKIIEQDGRVFVFSGDVYLVQPFIDWFIKGKNAKFLPVHTPRDELWMLAFEGGKLWEFGLHCPYPVECGVPIALGSGRQYAMGALALGHGPQEAVLAAIRCDPFSGGQVDHLVLPKHLHVQPSAAITHLWDYKPNGRALGGIARIAKLTSEERKEFARSGAKARWAKKGETNADN